jgi:molecular chaperone GrpE
METFVSDDKKPELDDDEVTLSSDIDENKQTQHEQDASEIGDESSEIAGLKDELALAKEQVLRAAAETQNARRRAEQDVERAHKFALE